jgi:chromate transporter
MERGKKSKTLLKIFITTLYLSTFTFGGGYVIVSLMKKKFVDENHWIEQDEMLDLVAIAQSSPGPIAINGAIAVGYKLCGMAGTLVAIIGTIISYCYSAFRTNCVISEMLEGMQAGVAAVIASVTYDMGADIVKQKDDLGILFMIAAFVASYILEINVVFIVIVCGLVGVCRGQLEKRRGHGHKKTEDTSDGNPENHPDKGGME